VLNLKIIDKMTNSLEQRFLKNKDMDAYARAELLLVSNDLTQDELQQQCNTSCAVFKDIEPGALTNELSMLAKCRRSGSSDIPSFQSLDDVMAFFSKRPAEYRALFRETIKMASLLTVAPATTATAERSFSCLKRLKTWLRSTMTQHRLNSCAILHAHRDVQPEMIVVLQEFIELNEGRKRIFGRKFACA
jgi:hypothetical protein